MPCLSAPLQVSLKNHATDSRRQDGAEWRKVFMGVAGALPCGLNSVAQFLPGGEFDDIFTLDLDGFTCLGIAALAGFAV